MQHAVALALALISVTHAGAVSAQEHRFGAGISAGMTRLGEATGRSRDLVVAIAATPAAMFRLELGDTEFEDHGRSDRRGSLSLVLDAPRSLAIGWLRLTPFVEVGFGMTETTRFRITTTRPHVQAGAGLRLGLGSRVELSARVQRGVERTPEDVLIVDVIEPPIVDAEREPYSRLQLGGSLRF